MTICCFEDIALFPLFLSSFGVARSVLSRLIVSPLNRVEVKPDISVFIAVSDQQVVLSGGAITFRAVSRPENSVDIVIGNLKWEPRAEYKQSNRASFNVHYEYMDLRYDLVGPISFQYKLGHYDGQRQLRMNENKPANRSERKNPNLR